MKLDQIEVHGSAMQNILDGCGVFQMRVKNMLAERGIENVDANTWYSLKSLIEVQTELKDKVGKSVLVQIGKNVPKNSPFPPGIDTFEKALLTMNDAYHMSHRGGDIGNYNVKNLSPTSFNVVCETPYPSSFNLGLIKGLASKFGVNPRITEVNSTQGGVFEIDS